MVRKDDITMSSIEYRDGRIEILARLTLSQVQTYSVEESINVTKDEPGFMDEIEGNLKSEILQKVYGEMYEQVDESIMGILDPLRSLEIPYPVAEKIEGRVAQLRVFLLDCLNGEKGEADEQVAE